MKSMGFVDAVKSVLVENYANFKGRARRSEYWYYTLASFIAGFICGLLPIPFIAPLLSLVLFIPGLAVSVRRLHDIGKSGWMYLLILIPVVVLLFFSFGSARIASPVRISGALILRNN